MNSFPTLGKPFPPISDAGDGGGLIGVPTLIMAHTTAVCWFGVGSRCFGQEVASEEGERYLQGLLLCGAFIHPPSIHSLLHVYDMLGCTGHREQ